MVEDLSFNNVTDLAVRDNPNPPLSAIEDSDGPDHNPGPGSSLMLYRVPYYRTGSRQPLRVGRHDPAGKEESP